MTPSAPCGIIDDVTVIAMRDTSAADMQDYVAAARSRSQERKRLLAARSDLAWQACHRVATMLKETYGVTRVAVFGSLVHGNLFHQRSDIDLAVWGLSERDYFRAVGRALALSPGIEVDLVEVERASPALGAVIEREAVDV